MKAYIKNIAYYLPKNTEENITNRLREKSGIERRHIAAYDETAADMAIKVAQKLSQSVSLSDVDYLLFCTQSSDYILPSTSCILQDKLGISKHCGTLEYNHGCSGYIYGLGLAKGLIESGQAKKVVLLTAETYSKYISPKDNAVVSLFGDAATATLVVAEEAKESGIYGFEYGSDGAGFNHLIVPVGGMRHRYEYTEIKTVTDKYGNTRTNRDLFMNGGAIMDFALNIVPKTLETILSRCSLKRNDIDYYVFHQANCFMLLTLQRICKLENFPFWNDVKDYGNTVSNSIPIALVDMMNENTDKNLKRTMLIGFGVGLSWGGCIVDLSRAT